jgi:hypothetical protein
MAPVKILQDTCMGISRLRVQYPQDLKLRIGAPPRIGVVARVKVVLVFFSFREEK